MKGAASRIQPQRNRSPAHPAFDLTTALERVRTLYDREHFSWTPLATALKYWGYGPQSSSGLRTLAALRHFALLDEAGRGSSRRFTVSALGKTILLRQGSETQHRAAIRAAALKPPIYAKLWVAWGVGRTLPSQTSMRYQLETEWGFNPNAIDVFVANLRSTLEFAGLISSAHISDDTPESLQSKRSPDPDRIRIGATLPAAAETNGSGRLSAEVVDFTIPLHDTGVAILSIPFPLSDQNFTQVGAWLKWARRALVDHEKNPAPSRSRSSA